MTHALLTEDTFIGQNFTKHSWQGIELEDKVFCDCTFDSCHFNEALWLRCEFQDCTFINCELSNLKLPKTKLRELFFKGCKLIGIDWTTAYWPNVQLHSPINFDGCLLDYSTFFGLCIKEIKIEDCQARDVNFTEANCRNASFIGSDLEGSVFNQTDLSYADFVDAQHYMIDLQSNKLTKAKFSLPDAIGLLSGLDIELVD